MSADAQKKAAGEAAAELVEAGMVVGLVATPASESEHERIPPGLESLQEDPVHPDSRARGTRPRMSGMLRQPSQSSATSDPIGVISGLMIATGSSPG